MAKSANRITQLRKDIDQLRKNYTGAFASANRAVYDGIENLAEHELHAIKTHYEEAFKNLKTLKKGGAPRDLAAQQLVLLQETIDRILSNARESLSILDATRRQISAEIRDNIEGSGARADSAVKQTREAGRNVGQKDATQARRTGSDAVAEAQDAVAAAQQSGEAAVAKTRSSKSTAKKRAPKKPAAQTAKKTGKTTASGSATTATASTGRKSTTASATPAREKTGTTARKTTAGKAASKTATTKASTATPRKRKSTPKKTAASATSSAAPTDSSPNSTGSPNSDNNASS